MIDYVAEEGADVEDIEFGYEPDPVEHWFATPLLSFRETFATIKRSDHLDKWSLNLFEQAFERPRSDLTAYYLLPNLYVAASHYIYCTPDPNIFRYSNWRPEMTAA